MHTTTKEELCERNPEMMEKNRLHRKEKEPQSFL
jgi:hypothetical protein